MRPPAAAQRTATGSLTPMIDVVFLLIIFFLVSSHLARRDRHMPVDLPVADTAADADPAERFVTVTVVPPGDWYTGGRKIEPAELRTLLNDRRVRDAAGSIATPLRIRCDGNVTYDRIEPLLAMAASVGISDIRVAVNSP